MLQRIVSEFERIYKTRDENMNYEKELAAKLDKLQRTRERGMDMFTDGLITRKELNDRIGNAQQEIEKLENERQMVTYNLTKAAQLEDILNATFKQIEDVTDVSQMSNVQIKRIIQKIEIDHDGNVEIYLKLLGDLGLGETVILNDTHT